MIVDVIDNMNDSRIAWHDAIVGHNDTMLVFVVYMFQNHVNYDINLTSNEFTIIHIMTLKMLEKIFNIHLALWLHTIALPYTSLPKHIAIT